MMEVCAAKDISTETTKPSGLSYCFTPKHHGAGSRGDACWLPELSRSEEFGIFNEADRHQLVDEDGNLYGLRIRQTGTRREILALGTRQEMIARFWAEPNQAPWHGHPLWPIITREALNRKNEKYQPSKIVFRRMIEANLLTENQASRLKKGQHVRILSRSRG